MAEKKRSTGPVSLAEVAKAAGVSKMTASRVLRNATGFSEATRLKVLREVERLGYVPNKIAAAFASDAASTLIGVNVPQLGSETFARILEGIDRALGRFGYQTVVGASEHSLEAEETWVEAILAWRPAGLILTGRQRSARTIDMLKQAAVPLVEIWDLNSKPLDMCVGFSHFDAGYEMGRLVATKRYQRFGYVGVDLEQTMMGAARLDGFCKALKDAGKDLPTRQLLKDTSSFYAGFYGTEHILSRQPDLDLIYYLNDNMAAGGLMYCQSRGLDVPKDIGIAGWGSMDITAILPKRLTTTSSYRLKIGKVAAENILNRIHGNPVPDKVDVEFHLVPGSTV
ncbi:LacI family DNA-binding transcriptional regulator [Pelagibius sp.]|uniref:LacI family DNA-binding transcriptional regulator n=1 Tax=Pelagibius sp. TaxID=1931238 RepID=UPI002613820D|nr:LacI family DNA-binding transcriptional regulator [Pelagibius sp.]